MPTPHNFQRGFCTECGLTNTDRDARKPCSGTPPWERSRVARTVGFDPTTGEIPSSEVVPVSGSRQGLSRPTVQVIETEPAHARRTDPGTSKAAAQRVETGSLNARIVAALKECGGMTIAEVAAELHEEQITVSPRFKPLRRAGLIRNTGERRINAGTRNPAIVWEAGRDEEFLAQKEVARASLADAARRIIERAMATYYQMSSPPRLEWDGLNLSARAIWIANEVSVLARQKAGDLVGE